MLVSVPIKIDLDCLIYNVSAILPSSMENWKCALAYTCVHAYPLASRPLLSCRTRTHFHHGRQNPQFFMHRGKKPLPSQFCHLPRQSAENKSTCMFARISALRGLISPFLPSPFSSDPRASKRPRSLVSTKVSTTMWDLFLCTLCVIQGLIRVNTGG